MNVQKFYGIKNWAVIARGENGETENEFLGKSDSDDEYGYCESSYNNPQSDESIQITEKKNQMQTAGYTSKTYIFCIKCEMFLCLNKNKNCFKYFTKTKSIQIVM